jgi:hypothetical protein
MPRTPNKRPAKKTSKAHKASTHLNPTAVEDTLNSILDAVRASYALALISHGPTQEVIDLGNKIALAQDNIHALTSA